MNEYEEKISCLEEELASLRGTVTEHILAGKRFSSGIAKNAALAEIACCDDPFAAFERFAAENPDAFIEEKNILPYFSGPGADPGEEPPAFTALRR